MPTRSVASSKSAYNRYGIGVNFKKLETGSSAGCMEVEKCDRHVAALVEFSALSLHHHVNDILDPY